MTAFVGASVNRLPGKKYRESLNFVELAFSTPLPNTKLVADWRAELEDSSFRVALRAPYTCLVSDEGPLAWNEQLKGYVNWLAEATKASKAKTLLLATPKEINPGARDRGRFEAYLEELRKRLPKKTRIAWMPAGMWEAESATKFASKNDLDLSFDPIASPDFSWSGRPYVRPRALGIRARFSEGILYDIAETIRANADSETSVVIDSPRSFDDAKQLLGILGEM